ncbi:MAG: tRNA uracil 4-sulfurtransferase ThiI [Pseudomonadota bacterium]
MATSIIVLRYGELFLKGANRAYFEKILAQNIHQILVGIPDVRLERAQGRMFVACNLGFFETALNRLRRVFGISSLSPAIAVPQDINAISEAACELLRKRETPIKSFKVETQRSDKSFPLISPEINCQVGAKIVEEFNLPVDLHNPELIVGVEIGQIQNFVYFEKLQGAGGLPVGSSSRILLLLSGGIDSPVAGHLLQKRGCWLRAVYFHSPPHTNEHAKDKVLQLAETLALAQGKMTVHIVDFSKTQEQIRNHAPPETLVVLYRRMMMRIAASLARKYDCPALATGENLGQVASQTVENMACIQNATDLPVLRPLLTYDKQETIDLAQRISTYPISILPYIDCCSLFVPKHPSTKLTISKAQEAEERLDIDSMTKQATDTVENVDVEGEF